MVLCFAIGCNHQTGQGLDCSFYRFPKDAKMHSIWTKMSRRSDRKPGKDARLCSCHFKDGNKENHPSIFCYNEGKNLEVSSPKKKRFRRDPEDERIDDNLQSVVTTDANESILDVEKCHLRAENLYLKQQIEDLKKLNAKSCKFLFCQISENDNKVLMYTGLPNKNVFYTLLEYISRLKFKYAFKWNVELLTLEDQLFITLQKLRQNYAFSDLAVRYSVSETTIRNVFFTILNVLHESIFVAIMCSEEAIPSLNKIQHSMPNSDFPNCRFLIDTTEIFIENPRSDLNAQRQTYSHYKKRQTFKALSAVAPNGVICFCSKLYPGATSDKIVFKECGIIQLLKPGDLILADKGFLVHDLLPQGVSLNIPPFLINPQFTNCEAKFTTKLARIRVHVERAFQRIKNFEILDNIPHYFYQSATVIFQVCAALVNLQNPILKK